MPSDATRAKMDSATADALDSFLAQMRKDKPNEVMTLDDPAGIANAALARDDVVSTGAISLDVALGVGGLARGRIVELFGPEMSGKTSLALSIAANAQARGIPVGFIDAEHALNRKHVLDMGCNPELMVVYQPDHGEDGLEMTQKMAESGGFGFIIVDSVAALTPKAEIEGTMEDQHVGLQARMMAKGLRKVTAAASQTNTTIIFINQLREKIGQMYGNPETTPGGRALKFYASVRIEVRSPASKRIIVDKQAIGQICTAKVVKNKLAPPFREAEYDLIFGEGIQRGAALLNVCVDLGVIVRSGSSYKEAVTGEQLGVGKENVKAAIESDPELEERLTAAVYATLQGDVTSVDEAEGDI